MRRIATTLLVLLIGSLVLWESISWGTRTWVKYKLLKEPLPSITTLLPTSMIQPIITTLLITTIIIVAINGIIRSRKLFGLIQLSELNRHVVVLGPTGSGKTSVAKAIIEKVLRSAKPTVKVTILDWKGEYRSLPDATVIRKINVWDVGGRTPAERAVIAVELLREVTRDIADISSASAALLLKELVKLYEKGTPTIRDVIERIEAFLHAAMAERRLAEANMAAALLRRLYWLQIDEERPDESVHRNNAVTIYDLSATGSNYLKTLYSLTILTRKYYEALRRGTADELVEIIIAEECQNYVRGRRFDDPPSIGERVVYELRGFGVGVVLVCPDPELLPPSILKDVGAVVAMGPDSLPRFALERYLFRASLEEAEDTLKKLKKSRMVVYYKNQLHFFRRLPRIPKPPKTPKPRPKGDRMGVTDPEGRSLRAWPILPHRSPGRPAPKVVEVKEEAKKPEVIEIRKEAAVEEKPKIVEVKEEPIVEKLRLEPEELEEVEEPVVVEVEVEKSSEPIAEPIEKEAVEEAVEVKEEKVSEEEKEELTEEVPMAVEPEPAPKGPPIPSTLPYRGSLCPAGRSVTSGRALLLEGEKRWLVGVRQGGDGKSP